MIKEDKLENGMTVVTEEIDLANSVYMGLWVKAGSRDENRQNAGISHFLEHMNFKGTERRSAKDLAEVLESRGGQLNAYTTKEYTTYYSQVAAEDWQLSLDVLADLFLHSSLLPEEIEKEKKVIIEEINLYEDSPEDLVIDLLNGIIWGDHPLAGPILGSEEAVKAISREELILRRERYYTPENTVLAVVGKCNHRAIVDLATKLFQDYQSRWQSRLLEKGQCFSGELCQVKDIMQEHICLGFPGTSIFDEDYYALILLNEALGGSASSRLFQKIREDKALSYSVFSFITAYQDCGSLSIYAGTSKGKGEEVRELCLAEIQELQNRGVSDAELKKLKNQLNGGLRISLDSLSSRLSRLGRNYLYFQRNLPIDEVMSSLNRVTVGDIQKIAARFLNKEKMAYAFLGGKDEQD